MDHTLRLNTAQLELAISDLLKKQVLLADRLQPSGTTNFQHLYGDGSSRIFVRVLSNKEPLCIGVLAPSSGERDMAEFRSSVEIGGHLHRSGLPVPEILAVDEDTGLILFEDLGDTRLHDKLTDDRPEALALYKQVVRELGALQVEGARGFDRDWCYDSPEYDTEVMLNRESGYFYGAFWEGLLRGKSVPGLGEEFEDIACRVTNTSEPLFLHRDFQSRNIMISNNRIVIIDFQAGRLGPPAYDLASLLIDPYAALSHEEQEELFDLYIDEMKAYPHVSIDKIIRGYPYLALQRNLQIIGAFAFLSMQRQKLFFKPFIFPSLVMLQKRLNERTFQPYTTLRQTVTEAVRRYRAHNLSLIHI